MRVRDVRLPLLLLLEVCWGWALAAVLAQIFAGGGAAGPSVLGTAFVVLGSYSLATALRQFDIGERTMRIVGVGATVLCLALVVPLEFHATLSELGPPRGAMFGTSVAFVALWVRGILRGRVRDEFDGAFPSVAVGLLPIAIAAGTLPDAHGPQAFGALAVVYGMLGLLVLALYRAAEPARTVRTLASQWGAATVAVVAVAGLMLVLAAAVDPGSFGFLAPIGEPLRVAGRAFVQYVLGPPLAALGKLFDLLIPDGQRQLRIEPQEPREDQRRDPENDGPAWALPVRYIIGGLTIAGVALLALTLLALLFRRVRRTEDEEEPDATEREGTLAGDLGDLFGSLSRRFRRPGTHRSAVSIRRLYAEMLERASVDGLERPPSATPLQFAPRLDAQYRSSIPSDITLAFTASRYGARVVDERVVRDLRARWEQLGRT